MRVHRAVPTNRRVTAVPVRPVHRPGREHLAGVFIAAGLVLASTGPAGAKTPYFSIELTPAEATADRPLLVDVRLWGDPAHTLPGRDDEWARSFADVSPTLDTLLVVRTDDVARIPEPWRRGPLIGRPDGSVDLPVTLRRSGLDTYRGIVWLPEGTWTLMPFPDRTGWATPSLSPGYPDAVEVTVGPGADAELPCPVTAMGHAPVEWASGMWGSGAAVGDEHLWAGGFGADSVVLVDRRDLQPDGTIGAKLGWWRITPGALTITGRRLDGDAPRLLADVPDGYGASGFQVSGVMFPTEGCWEVTGSVGGHSLSVVVYVMLTPP